MLNCEMDTAKIDDACSEECVVSTDDWLHLLVLREGKEMEMKYQLNLRRPLVPVLAGVDCVPSYFIIGGLVFVPLSIPFLEHAYGGAQTFLPATPYFVLVCPDIAPVWFASIPTRHLWIPQIQSPAHFVKLPDTQDPAAHARSNISWPCMHEP